MHKLLGIITFIQSHARLEKVNFQSFSFGEGAKKKPHFLVESETLRNAGTD